MFEHALNEMAKEGREFYGPRTFHDYIRETGQTEPKRGPQPHISVDSLKSLKSELRESNTMVLRLGRGTFSLVQAEKDVADFFLCDEPIFQSCQKDLFVPTVPMSTVLPFQLLPRMTENSLVNLVFATGLLHHALGIDDTRHIGVPATGQSTFSFEFKPRATLDKTFTHENGQVEVDAIFTARRGGKQTLFVVEAKTSDGLDSLAKHKLAYSALAVAGRVPKYMPIVPVYLRAIAKPDGRHFLVAECGPIDRDCCVLDHLETRRVAHLVLPGFQ